MDTYSYSPANTNQHASVESYEGSTLAAGSLGEGVTSNKSMGGMGMFLKGILPTGLVPKYFESEWSFAQVN